MYIDKPKYQILQKRVGEVDLCFFYMIYEKKTYWY